MFNLNAIYINSIQFRISYKSINQIVSWEKYMRNKSYLLRCENYLLNQDFYKHSNNSKSVIIGLRWS